MAGKETYSLWGKISVIIGAIGVVIGIITIPWAGLADFAHRSKFLYDHVEELEHVIEDSHEVLGLQGELSKVSLKMDSLTNVIFVIQSRDSLVHTIELLNRGKWPYDSVLLESESGHLFQTTIEDHFIDRHND